MRTPVTRPSRTTSPSTAVPEPHLDPPRERAAQRIRYQPRALAQLVARTGDGRHLGMRGRIALGEMTPERDAPTVTFGGLETLAPGAERRTRKRRDVEVAPVGARALGQTEEVIAQRRREIERDSGALEEDERPRCAVDERPHARGFGLTAAHVLHVAQRIGAVILETQSAGNVVVGDPHPAVGVRRAAAHAIRALDHERAQTGFRRGNRRCQSGEPRTHDDHVSPGVHERLRNLQ